MVMKKKMETFCTSRVIQKYLVASSTSTILKDEKGNGK
jgi:hypothetical protein